jgi:hypothetical protein
VLRGKAADTACPSTRSQIKKVGAKEHELGPARQGAVRSVFVVVVRKSSGRRCRGTSQEFLLSPRDNNDRLIKALQNTIMYFHLE